MITRLRKGFGKITALIISAVVFGLVHGTPIAICYATFLGILFGVMYLVYDSIVPSVLCHIFFNMTSYFIAGFNVPIEYILVVSAVLVLFFGYRILIRRPTFSDILSDRGGRIKGRTEEENRIFDEIRALTKREDVTAYDVDNLSEEFDRVMKKRREPKFNRKR